MIYLLLIMQSYIYCIFLYLRSVSIILLYSNSSITQAALFSIITVTIIFPQHSNLLIAVHCVCILIHFTYPSFFIFSTIKATRSFPDGFYLFLYLLFSNIITAIIRLVHYFCFWLFHRQITIHSCPVYLISFWWKTIIKFIISDNTR